MTISRSAYAPPAILDLAAHKGDGPSSMKLSARVGNGEALVQDFELAAEERFLDAEELLVRGNATGATYLAGYVAEIVLKYAVFRFDGAALHDVTTARLAPVKRWAQHSLPGIPFTSYHNVLFWAHVLRKKRVDRGRPLPELVSQNLMRVAFRVHGAWSVHLRYFGLELAIDSAKSMFMDVAWLKKNHGSLWR
jgi:hypothetical protein